MNLLITEVCNAACPYCFAADRMRQDRGTVSPHMSVNDFDFCLDFLERSGRKDARIMGGEPTLHPRFTDLIRTAVARGFDTKVFTNGFWPDPVLRFVEEHPDDVFFVFNLNEPGDASAAQEARLAESLAAAGQQGMASFNIYRDAFDLLFVEGAIRRHGLEPLVRVGLAAPITGADNRFLPDASLPNVGRRLVEQLRGLHGAGIAAELDCGFTRCMFDDGDMRQLESLLPQGFRTICRAAPDVGTDLSVWPCFPLARLCNTNLREHDTLEELCRHFEKLLAPFRTTGSRDECITCELRMDGQCAGGCLSRGLRDWTRRGDPALLDRLARAGSPRRGETS